MYLRFEDWSQFTGYLDRKGISHGGRIIKIYATDEDPRIKFGKEGLAVVESSDEPFKSDEVFDFGERGVFTGQDLEDAISAKQANELAGRTARALARFAVREDTRFAYVGMQVKVGERFLIQHPLDGIDGWERVVGGQQGQEGSLHLDIFTPTSLGRLRQIVDFEDSTRIRTHADRIAFGKEQLRARGKEREI